MCLAWILTCKQYVPDLEYRIYEHHLAGTAVPWWDRWVLLTAHFCVTHQNLLSVMEALYVIWADDQTLNWNILKSTDDTALPLNRKYMANIQMMENYRDHTFFHALTFARSRGSCLNTRLKGWVFNHLQRNQASVNAMKQTCVIVILAYLTLFQPKSHWKRC